MLDPLGDSVIRLGCEPKEHRPAPTDLYAMGVGLDRPDPTARRHRAHDEARRDQ